MSSALSRADVLNEERQHLQLAGAQEDAGYSALCLSGGGIRSASFALGVIQGLAQRRLLESFDYLSTVSGGGFAGGWLSAWLRHAVEAGDRDAVFRQLRGLELAPGTTEAAPVSKMRSYSRYMSPELGSLSADAWTLAATMVRNIFLNWTVLLPLIAAALLVPRVYLELVQALDQPLNLALQPVSLFVPSTMVAAARANTMATALFLISTLLMLAGSTFVAIDLPSYGNSRRTQAQFLAFCLTPLVLGLIGMTLFWAANVVPVSLGFAVGVSVIGGAATWIVFGQLAGSRKWRPLTWMAGLLSTPIVGAGMWWLTNEPFQNSVNLGPLYCTLAPPMAMGFLALTSMVFVALASAEFTDGDLEWFARYNAWLLITMVVWLGAAVLVFYAPLAFRALRDFLANHLSMKGSHAVGLMGGTGSLLGTALAYLLRPSTSTDTAAKPSTLRTVALMIAAPLFVVLLLGTLAWLNAVAIDHLYASGFLSPYQVTPGGRGTDDATVVEVLAVAAILMGVGFVTARFVPVNMFSLHGMYRERLIRAFLGASRQSGQRQPNPFTGFDPSDNLPMHELAANGRPFHVVNTTLNRVAEKGLAMQFRKAESFTVTALHAGSSKLNAYRPSKYYADERVGKSAHGITLGTTMSISGAAASPNMGAKSSPSLTFLMTMFNARLGVWLGNPGPIGEDTWQRSEPKLGVGPLIQELLGQTTDANPYVYLSDGGHFENLGLWEMVMRRCRWILVSDAGCDPDYKFADLANAVRLIRIDLGVPIVFDEGVSIDGDQKSGTNRCFAVARIQYSAVDGPKAEDGILIYVKATLSGIEPVDVANYAKGCPSFPHESTADQWFTEAQFESYRMLGFSSILKATDGYTGEGSLPGLFRSKVRRAGGTGL